MNEEVKDVEIKKPKGSDIIAPIGTGIKLPPLHATGDLTVENKDETKVVVVEDDNVDSNKLAEELSKTGNEVILTDNKTEAVEEKWEPILPEMHTKFQINGRNYKVCYINEGKGRFSAIPCK